MISPVIFAGGPAPVGPALVTGPPEIRLAKRPDTDVKSCSVAHLSPVHTSNNAEATLSNATKSNVASTQCGPGFTYDSEMRL